MRAIIAKNFSVEVDSNLGKFWLTAISTQAGEVYGIDYQEKYDPNNIWDVPSLVTVVTYKDRNKRNAAARKLRRYINNENDLAEFYLNSKEYR